MMKNLSLSSSEKRFLAAKKRSNLSIIRHLPVECQKMRTCWLRVGPFDTNTSTTSCQRSFQRTKSTSSKPSQLDLSQASKVGYPETILSQVQNWSAILLRRVRGRAWGKVRGVAIVSISTSRPLSGITGRLMLEMTTLGSLATSSIL